MKIKFKQNIRLLKRENICCFSGIATESYHEFANGDIIECHSIEDIQPWIKTKRKQPKACRIVLENYGRLHPDHYAEVPKNCFEIVKPSYKHTLNPQRTDFA